MTIFIERPECLTLVLLLLLVAQIVLYIFAIITKKEYLWIIEYIFIALCLFFGNHFLSYEVDSFAPIMGMLFCYPYSFMLIASLITRTALIPYMKKWPLCVGLWVVFFVAAYLIFQKSILLW